MSRTILYSVCGAHLTRADIAELAGVTPECMHARLQKMTPLEAVLAPRAPTQGVNMIGVRFGRLVVVEEEQGKTAANKRRYRCQCDCGNTKVVIGADLRSGKTVSCNCQRVESASAARIRGAEDMSGRVFADGWVTVLGAGDLVSVNKGRVDGGRIRSWRCQCKCGKPFETKASFLRAGQTTSCGCRKIAIARERMKAKAPRFDFFGVRLTLAEIAEASGVEGPTIAHRMRSLNMTAEQAATIAPLRRFAERPRGRHAASRQAA